MKKKLFTLLALFACVLSASADNTISVKKVYITPGGVASFGIDLDNTDELCGFTMFMTLPEGITLNGEQKCGDAGADGFAINKTARTQGELVDPTGTNPYGLGYISTKALPNNTGAIIQVNIKAASTLTAGTVLSGKIYDINFGALGGGSDIHLDDANFEIVVTDKIILDEESTVIPSAQEDAVNVCVKRELKGGVWNTICLPFKMTKDQVSTILGSVQIAEIDNISSEGDAFTVTFKNRTASNQILANKVYIIKPAADIHEFNINTTVTPVASPKTTYEDPDEGIELGTAYGTLCAGVTIPKDHIFISGNSFYYSTGSTVIKGFRGYFKLEGFKTSSPAPVFVVDGEETTNIEGLQILTDDGQFYNLKGQKVDNPTEKGVYIQNGKKIVVK